jgi:energy-coupling factor transport system ATP-binding protein
MAHLASDPVPSSGTSEGQVASSATSAIEVSHFTYRYPTAPAPVLVDVSLSVPTGGFLGILGADGAGKSTLALAMRGLLSGFYHGEVSGEVLIEGIPTSAYDVARLAGTVGLVLQNPSHQLSGVASTVFDEVAFGPENLGVEAGEIRRAVDEALAVTHLSSLAERNPLTLSGGQQQRLALASALALRPRILVLDEPTAQIDPSSSTQLLKVIGDLRSGGVTVVMVEHDTALVARFATQVVVLDAGRVVAQGEPGEVLIAPGLEEHGVLAPWTVRFAHELAGRIPAQASGLPAACLTEEQTVAKVGFLLGASDRMVAM